MSILKKSNQQIFCDLIDDKKLQQHKQVRGRFVKEEEEYRNQELKALKKTLSINKEIISSLIMEQPDSKQALSKLNDENIYLLNQTKLLKRQRDTYHRKCFLAEQVIAELRYKERDDFKDYRETAINFIDELDSKEFTIQNLQYKYNRLEEVVRKYAKEDQELASLLNEFDTDRLIHARRITGIVHENKKLNKELKTVKQKLFELEHKLQSDMSTSSLKLEKNISNEINTTREDFNADTMTADNSPVRRVDDSLLVKKWVENGNKMHSESTSKDSSIDLELKEDVNTSTADFETILVIMNKENSKP